MTGTAALVAGWGLSRARRAALPSNVPGPMNPAGNSYAGDLTGGPIMVTTEIYLGGMGWVDISAFTQYRDGATKVTVSRGQPNMTTVGSSVPPQQATLTLHNRDFRFSPRNPNGPYYGLIGRNTPIRISRWQNGIQRFRFHGEVPDWPTTSDQSGNDVYMQLTPAGPLRRFNAQSATTGSALYRWYTLVTGPGAPVGYWPCEDGSSATIIASGLPSGTPMIVTGTAAFAAEASFEASDAIPTLEGSTWNGAVPTQPGTPAMNDFRFLISVPSTGDTNNATAASFYTTGTIARVDVVYGNTGSLTVNCYSSTGTNIGTTGPLTPLFTSGGMNGILALVDVNLAPSGSSVAVGLTVYWATSPTTALASASATVSSASLGQPVSVTINPAGGLTGTAIGHIAIELADDGMFDQSLRPYAAWIGEAAVSRLKRLATEQGLSASIPPTAIGVTAIGQNPAFASLVGPGFNALTIDNIDPAFMGPQLDSTFVNLLQEVPAADVGLLYEARDQVGVGYRHRVSLYNQGTVYNNLRPSVTLDMAQFQVSGPLNPVDDDLLTANDVTVSRVNGSSVRLALTSGAPLSTQPPPAGVGDYEVPYSVSLSADSALTDETGWYLHLGTVGEPRYPQIAVNLRHPSITGNTGLLNALLTVDVGDVITIVNPPTDAGPGPITCIIQGYTESMGVWEHDIVFNTVPASAYQVAMVEDQVLGRCDTDGSTLAAPNGPTDTTMSLATTNTTSPLWTMLPQDFPFDVAIGGERITVVGPGSTLGADPFLAQGLAQYTGQNATIALDATRPWPTNSDRVLNPYAPQALTVTPTGGNATVDAVASNSPAGSVAVNTSYTVWAWVYSLTGRTYQVFVNWGLNGVYVSTSTGSAVSTTAGVWTLVSAVLTSPGSGINQASLGVVDGNTPTSAQTFTVWGLNATATASLSQASPQQYTVTRSVNGVVKAQTAGTDVRLWTPPVPGL